MLGDYPWWTLKVGEAVDDYALSAEAVVELHDTVYAPMDFAGEGSVEVC